MEAGLELSGVLFGFADAYHELLVESFGPKRRMYAGNMTNDVTAFQRCCWLQLSLRAEKSFVSGMTRILLLVFYDSYGKLSVPSAFFVLISPGSDEYACIYNHHIRKTHGHGLVS